MLQLALLNSCGQEADLKALTTIHSNKEFYYDDTYLEATGVWKSDIGNRTSGISFITNHDIITVPHVVKIVCDKERKQCSLRETILGKMDLSDGYYLSSNEIFFRIQTWNKNTIIAIIDEMDSCFTSVLYIDINTQEVHIKSFVPNKHINFDRCKMVKSSSTPIIRKLVDYRESPYKYYITLKTQPINIE